MVSKKALAKFKFLLFLIPIFLTLPIILGSRGQGKVNIKLVRNDMSLTHACSYYEIDMKNLKGKYLAKPSSLIEDLETLNVSKVKEVRKMYGLRLK